LPPPPVYAYAASDARRRRSVLLRSARPCSVTMFIENFQIDSALINLLPLLTFENFYDFMQTTLR